jgi:hypothetical protein
VSVALVRRARSRDPRRTSTITKPATTPSGCMRLRRAPKSTANSTIRRLRLCEPVRCKRKRWTSGTSHLAMVNSRCAHGLQKPFSAQPKTIARLASKSRSRRLESLISFIPWVTGWASGNRWGCASMSSSDSYQRLVSNSCRAVKRGIEDPMIGEPVCVFSCGARQRNCRD